MYVVDEIENSRYYSALSTQEKLIPNPFSAKMFFFFFFFFFFENKYEVKVKSVLSSKSSGQN